MSARLLQRIRQLIATPSVSSVSPQFDQSNQAVIDLLANWLEDAGCTVQVQPLAQPGKANLLATLGSGSDGLVLAGHTDTVPYNPELWQHDPFAAVVENERLYGLGTADMKGFLAIAVEALSMFNPASLRRPLTIVATADEESSMHGARILGEVLPPQRSVVLGEPTELKPVRMHKGMGMEAIRVLGKSGHSSNPALGVNALEGMHQLIAELLRWRAELQEQYHHTAFAVPVPTVNLGHIHGGDNPNRICGDCELHIDLRPLPGMSLQSMREQLRTRLANCIAGSALTLSFNPLFPGIEPFETPATAPIVQLAEELSGAAAQAASFGTEAPFFNALGMQTVILGPGSVTCAHQPDEFLPLADLAPTLHILQGFIQRLCCA